MIDWQRVDELRQEIGAEEFLEVVEMFVEESDEVVAELETCQGPDGLKERLHFLKGSALNLGFQQMAEICRQGERLAAAGQPERIDLAALRALYADSRAALVARLQAFPAA
ncbi:Hpt domain-containing protein [Psychromarinibacter sp. C21-152]|uniref:Hpt domain-containing protein n=1 Tax=Psychromarinibacter sediminicola TaxID=3033385 RepID=A0AAE3NSQ3_9RHOB|nr:Hpt domain-containing protein [Psychromarinibacter sediminicola]MDF0601321.1 Hpt domain-containing protein [Psychromarinibacter sediminicola]